MSLHLHYCMLLRTPGHQETQQETQQGHAVQHTQSAGTESYSEATVGYSRTTVIPDTVECGTGTDCGELLIS